MVLYTFIAVFSAVLICTGSCSLCKGTSKDIFSTVGSTVNLTCNIDVDIMYVNWLGPPSLIHYAIGNVLEEIKGVTMQLVGNEKDRQNILQIINMQETNEGLYKCTTTKGEDCFQVLIQKPPRNISIQSSNTELVVYGIVNNRINLTCHVETGNPPETMNWEYEHAIVATGGPGSLTYSFISEFEHHLKTFMCKVINNVTRTELKKIVSLYLYSKPTVKIIPGGIVNMTEDDTVLLVCNYTSNDNGNTSITWENTSKSHAKHIGNNSLKLERINRTEAGQYTCLVSNSAGETEDTMTLNVFYPPAVDITLEDQPSKRVLKCNAHGNPDDYVFSQWEHRTKYGDHIRFLNDSGSGCIILKNSSYETDRHHDQGIYTCSVSNGVLYHEQTYQFASFILKTKGLPYFATSSNRIQYGILGKETIITLNVVSYPIIKNVSVYNNQSVKMTNVKVELELSKIEDIVYGKKVNVEGYTMFVPIVIGAPDDFMTYSISVSNAYGQRNMSVDIRSDRKQHEGSSSYTAIHVTISLLIFILIVCGTLISYHYKKGNLIRKVDLSCLQWTYRRNAVGDQGVENGIYDMHNNLAPVAGAQSNDSPIYSSIDRKHKLSIGQTVSYSVTKKKKPNPLGARYRHKGKQHEETETDIEMSTSQAEENYQLNYVDVCFDPKPVGYQYTIHGIDQKSEYVDIDFSKSINVLPDNENIDGSDEDFSSVEDVIEMKKDMMF